MDILLNPFFFVLKHNTKIIYFGAYEIFLPYTESAFKKKGEENLCSKDFAADTDAF